MENYTLYEEYITLGQFIKEIGLINTGGQAKIFLAENEGKIFLNGETENRRGKKLSAGDTLEIPNFDLATTFRAATAAEIAEHQTEKEETLRVKALVKKLNAENNKQKSTKKPTKPHFPGRK
ncbi:S4 domain-containing protein YaaA [Lactococcus nasutitermitis]|uniref:S4 domain-containing protein YaaA n=1 Tax=Lactococcus nasutitermitis TaxID=1652957 RepID=A0ABV9JER5_9LACT|nr:S4 domain-containing protein YaaA [Lactococcus nasutitermitis]